jgi:hypothetical protein
MPVIAGGHAVVCLDYPDRVETVGAAQLSRWGLDVGQSFALGMHNVMAMTVTKECIDGPLGSVIHVHSSDSPYVAVRALAMERWVSGPHGALVAMPSAHHLIFHPIVDGRAMGAMQAIWMLAQPAYREGPASLQPHLYWWTPGRFMRIEVVEKDDGEGLGMRPPDAFHAVIDALMAAEEGGAG